MAKRYVRVRLSKKDGKSWSSTWTVLDDAFDVMVTRGIGKIKDTFSFKLVNARNKYYENSSGINQDDRVQIWLWSNTPWASLTTAQQNAAFQIDGTISYITQDESKGHIISVKGVGMIDVLFRSLVFVRNTALTKPHQIIQHVIAQMNDYNPTRTIYGKNSDEWGSTQTVRATLRRDLTAFPDIVYTSAYKSALEVIEEMSSNEYTNDGPYIFQIKYNTTEDRYDFYWHAKESNPGNAYIFVEGEIDDNDSATSFVGISMKESKEGVINAVIYNVGFDCYEHSWDFLAYDEASQVSDGASWKYITDTADIFPELIKQEQRNNSSYFNKDDNDNFTSALPTTFDNGGGVWTFQFYTRDSHGKTTGTKATATSGSTYNQVMKDEAEAVGKERVMKIIERWGEALWSGSLTFQQTNDYVEGGLIDLTMPSLYLTNQFVRLEEVQQTLNTTTLNVKEDEKSMVIG